MNCRELVESLIEYLDGELTPEEADLFRAHREKCPPCDCYVRTYQLTIHITRRLPPAPPPQRVLERLRQAVRDDHG
jgi:anti-sigma factor RsiW